MGVAIARSISYGAAYTDYITKKEKAVFLKAINFDGDYQYVFDNSELDCAWLELKESCPKYNKSGKRITNNVVKLELSPSIEESKDWKSSDYLKWSINIIKHMDDQTIPFKKRKRDKKTKQWIKDKDGKDKWFLGIVPNTNFMNSKILMMLHKDSKSGIWHVHAIMSRADIHGNINNVDEIAKRAARAAERVNLENYVTSAEKISEAHKAEIKDVIYNVLRSMEDFDWDYFKKAIEDKTFTNYKGETQHYEVAFRKDLKDNIVGYSIKRGNSIYSASQIGAQLTAKKIINEWHKLYTDNTEHMSEAHQRTGSRLAEHDKEVGGLQRISNSSGEPLPPVQTSYSSEGEKERLSAIIKTKEILRDFGNSNFNYLDYDEIDSIMPGIIANAIKKGFNTSNNEGLTNSVRDLLNGFNDSAKVLEEALRAVTIFLFPPDVPSLGGGGGQSNIDLPKKKDEEWEWWKNKLFGKKSAIRRKM